MNTAGAQGTPEELPAERRPYQVHIAVSFSAAASFTPEFRRDVVEEIGRQIDRTFGPMWDDTIVEDSRPSGRAGLRRLAASDELFNTPSGESSPDKRIFVDVNFEAPQFDISSRQWDAASRRLSPPESARTPERRKIASTAFALISRQFEPLLLVDEASPEGVRMRLHAGEFPAIDPELAQVVPGDLVVGFLRYLNRDRTVRQIDPIPWTYLLVDSVNRGEVNASLLSGLQALPRVSRSLQIVGLRRRPRHDATEVQVVTQKDPPAPLVGFTLEAVSKIRVSEEAQGPPAFFITDRSGNVRIPTQPGHPLVWLYVKSGESLLARVPLAPGLDEFQILRLPDDRARLAVEGQIELLKGRLVDAVARRNAAMAKIRALAREGDWTQAKQHIDELPQLPGAPEFRNELAAIRIPAVERAQKRNDKIAEARITRLCAETETLIQRFLDPERLRMFREEMEELRAAEAAEAPNDAASGDARTVPSEGADPPKAAADAENR